MHRYSLQNPNDHTKPQQQALGKQALTCSLTPLPITPTRVDQSESRLITGGPHLGRD